MSETNCNNRLVRRGLAKLWSRSPNVPVWKHRNNGNETRVHSSGMLLWTNGDVTRAHEHPSEWKLAQQLEPKRSRAMMKLAEILSANTEC